MRAWIRFRRTTMVCAVIGALLGPSPSVGQTFLHRHRKAAVAAHEGVTIKELAAAIDDLDEELFEEGTIGIKAPDVWGQNRMTKYRAEYEKEMADQVNKFTITLNAAIRRADTAVLTSATSIGAAIQAQAARGRSGAASSATAAPATTVVVPATPGATAQPLLDSISELLDKNAKNLPQLPSTLLPKDEIALEPKLGLDQRSDYLKHLQELRRTNAGDDLTDAPGYGLYLIRIPVSLLPGPEVRKGHGAMVTVEAKHALSHDLLPNTFRDVTIMDAAYQLNPILLKLVHDVPIPASNLPTATNQKDTYSAPTAGGSKPGSVPTIPSSESNDVFGSDEREVLLKAVNDDLADAYRHDPSILSWLVDELGAAHRFMREQVRNGTLADMFSAARFQELDLLLQQRNYLRLAEWRRTFIDELVVRRNGLDYTPGTIYNCASQKRATDVLVFALMVQSVLVDRQLKHDIDTTSQRNGCPCDDLNSLTFYDLFPSPEAREAFNAYVRCKWPIHVFAIDPAVEQQNHLDLFSARSEFQAALAVGIASGNLNVDQATKFARRLETDLETIGLNRTAVGFGAGETTFGWQFYPRIQTPPTPGNVRRLVGLIGGTSYNQDYIARNRFIEPGPRECVALIVAPNFVPAIHFTSFANWFEYVGKHADKKFDTGDVLEFSRKLQTARRALDQICDSGDYRPGEVARLADRISQLEAKLPSQDYRVPLPYEVDLTGSEVFNSSGARLYPRLLSWFGEPAQIGKSSTIFLYGSSFSVHETQVVAGGVPAEDPKMISRNVMEITIPAKARPIRTNDDRFVFDVHVATPNGVSNHLFVEADSSSATPTPTPAFGYTVATNKLTITYGVSGRTEGDPRLPGIATVIQKAPEQFELNWLEPVGLAPAKVKVAFNFPNLMSIEIPDLTPDKNGKIIIKDTTDAPWMSVLAQEILNRLQATAVTFDPIRNPAPLKAITTASIKVTPTTGTHAERTVDTSGTLTVSFTPLALPIPMSTPSGTAQFDASLESGAVPTMPLPPPEPAPNHLINPSSATDENDLDRSALPHAPPLPGPGAAAPSQRFPATPSQGSTNTGKVPSSTRLVRPPTQVGAANARTTMRSPRVERPIATASPNPPAPYSAQEAGKLRDPHVGRVSTTRKTTPRSGGPAPNERDAASGFHQVVAPVAPRYYDQRPGATIQSPFQRPGP